MRMRRPNWRGMTRSISACALIGLLATADTTKAADDASAAPPIAGITRHVTFELTFANRDLTWLGDPASPATMVAIKPGARPIATDLCVRTLTESRQSPARRTMREARVVGDGPPRTVMAFTHEREKAIGSIDAAGHFTANDFYRQDHGLLPSWPADPAVLKYDAAQNALYYEVDMPGPQLVESLDHLPLDAWDKQGTPLTGQFELEYRPAAEGSPDEPVIALVQRGGNSDVTLLSVKVPQTFNRSGLLLGSFDNERKTYWTENDYRAGSDSVSTRSGNGAPSVTFSITHSERADSPRLLLAGAVANAGAATKPAKIAIDGNFDDWRNVPGVDDPRGDLVPYLDYDPDVDLLEFKVANDDEHIYFYARVAGQVGRAHAPKGRGYFYAYMDVDRNAETGFLPTRDDDCYYGVDIGDDCEVQFEFVDSTFRKTFYGFCGLGGNDNVLKQIVTLGKSQYGRLDDAGRERADYKAEYVYRNGRTEITEDLKLGTSDTIRLAVSPDGSEVEIVSDLKGFLKNAAGEPTVRLGQSIDVAAGMECSGRKQSRDSRWAADSTPAIRGYTLKPVK